MHGISWGQPKIAQRRRRRNGVRKSEGESACSVMIGTKAGLFWVFFKNELVAFITG